jgi:hypothetical protein
LLKWKIIHPACKSILLLVKRIHPASPYYWWWKGYILHVQTAGSEKDTHCMHVHAADGGNGYTLHIHTAVSGKDTPCTSKLQTVERDTPGTSILQVMERDTPYTLHVHIQLPRC